MGIRTIGPYVLLDLAKSQRPQNAVQWYNIDIEVTYPSYYSTRKEKPLLRLP